MRESMESFSSFSVAQPDKNAPGPGQYDLGTYVGKAPYVQNSLSEAPAWSIQGTGITFIEDAIRTSYAPGPVYKIRSTVGGEGQNGYRRSPSHVFGSGPNRGSVLGASSPGPGSYALRAAVGSETDISLRGAPSHRFGTAPQRPHPEDGSMRTAKSRPKVSNVGPGAYTPDLHYASVRRSPPAFGFGTSPQRAPPKSKAETTPGPGAYDLPKLVGEPEQTDQSQTCAAAFKFGTAAQRPVAAEQPARAQYFGREHTAQFLAVNSPGPIYKPKEEFQSAYQNKTKPSWTFGSARRF
eukprot:tig00021073_g18066.t1